MAVNYAGRVSDGNSGSLDYFNKDIFVAVKSLSLVMSKKRAAQCAALFCLAPKVGFEPTTN